MCIRDSGHTLLGRTGISGLYPLIGMRTALTGPHLEQANVRHSTSLRVACGSMRLRYVNSKQTGHWPTVMTDIVSLHKHGSIDLQARCSKQIAEDPLVPPLGGVQKSDALRQSDTCLLYTSDA